MRIHQLPPIIANQIAAGEVIERPASVVKELLENAYDACADQISVEIGYGGLNQIKISDNGVGIVAVDLPLAIAAHATSKISTLNDLYAIHSMGFRGEALASIASVAKINISSKPEQQEHAMMLQSQGGDYVISPCARTLGTTIEVIDLFYNAPVRKKFLKGEKVEFQAIETVVKRFALAAPQIAISLKHNGKLIFSLPAAANEQAQQMRLTKIFGTAFMREAIYLNVERAGMHLSGWISGIDYQRSQNDRLWVYINQRMVKDKLINHALKQAYDDLLHPGRFPACLLYLTINPAEVDVNVHPTKHEVRFQQPRLVHDLLIMEIRNVLASSTITAQEPPAKLIMSEPAAMYEPVRPQNKTPVFEYKPALDSSVKWYLLNNRYALVFIQNEPVLVDVVSLYQHYMLLQLSQELKPLKSRPLLVPVTYSIAEDILPQRNELITNLSQFGLTVEINATDNKVRIREVPILMPHLNLRVFIDSLATVESITIDALQRLLSQTQTVDYRVLSLDEKLALEQWMVTHLAEEKYSSICKIITMDDCGKLMHA